MTPHPTTYPWGDTRPFNSGALHLRKHFGHRVQKLSINAGFTCPNRDGTKSTTGCTYCNNTAFSPSYCTPQKPIAQQIDEGIQFHRRRYRRASSYLAYFQPYTNTYAPIDHLQQIYAQALAHPQIAGIVIGTRPDCIDNQKLDHLATIARTHYVAIEYGIETCNDSTLRRINRCHTYADAVTAIHQTAAHNIPASAHIMFGLPGETTAQMIHHATLISQLPLATIKLHQLQILRGTPVEQEYHTHPHHFTTFTPAEYADTVIAFLEHLTPGIAVERLSAEVPPRYLATEPWSKLRADQIAITIENRMTQLGTWQGRYHHNTGKH